MKPGSAVIPRPSILLAISVCGGEFEMDAIWSPQRHQKISDAFASTGDLHAPALWSRSAAIIGDYADRWRSSARDSCEATRVRNEQSDLMFDLRQRFLGEEE